MSASTLAAIAADHATRHHRWDGTGGPAAVADALASCNGPSSHDDYVPDYGAYDDAVITIGAVAIVGDHAVV